MQTPAIPIGDELDLVSPWDDAPPPGLEDQEFDVLAFELWRQGSRQDVATEKEWLEVEQALGCHASCL